MNKLQKTSLYMNPFTGSVDFGSSWEIDFALRSEKEQDWEEWGGDSLIEVVPDESGNYIEAGV